MRTWMWASVGVFAWCLVLGAWCLMRGAWLVSWRGYLGRPRREFVGRLGGSRCRGDSGGGDALPPGVRGNGE
ncbi:hypothetical protein PLEOSDRAFT_1073051 [Pleurotus ostreatus PC15]|uniref:Uncharacterized protein n=1 Tax=Pleurotus ostreatus (strain PC15) TaxID=1137138 RepID=A0A067N1Y4_PLEO1|nr:hypothetical protein PLEOSDRAFT_1073051 [Pleurotus ostreatus PC15]